MENKVVNIMGDNILYISIIDTEEKGIQLQMLDRLLILNVFNY
ncbi:hypothetical protein [Clostridium senegalense]|nr:hypothetical protein [Clostridium senegalense]